MTYRAHVRNCQITLDEPAQLPEGAEVNVEVLLEEGNGKPGRRFGRQELLRMSQEQRRQVLTQQAERVAGYYQSDVDRSGWQGGEIVK